MTAQKTFSPWHKSEVVQAFIFCHQKQGYFRQNRVFHNMPEAHPESLYRMAWQVLRGDYSF